MRRVSSLALATLRNRRSTLRAVSASASSFSSRGGRPWESLPPTPPLPLQPPPPLPVLKPLGMDEDEETEEQLEFKHFWLVENCLTAMDDAEEMFMKANLQPFDPPKQMTHDQMIAWAKMAEDEASADQGRVWTIKDKITFWENENEFWRSEAIEWRIYGEQLARLQNP